MTKVAPEPNSEAKKEKDPTEAPSGAVFTGKNQLEQPASKTLAN